jgi:hypothetical protein
MVERRSYNLTAISEAIKRDNAVLLGIYQKTTKRTGIRFRCSCGKEGNKRCLEIVSRAGAFCRDCTLKRSIDKTKSTNKLNTNKDPICTIDSLNNTIQRDNATLLTNYDFITQNTVISFKCNCGEDSSKNCLQLISVSGAFCKKCTKKKKTEKQKANNLQTYGVECTVHAPGIKEKIEENNIIKYGSKNVFGSAEVKEKIKKTCLERYGVESAAQNIEVQERTQRNAKKYKDYKMPSGTIRKVQGYEPFALDYLITQYIEDNIKSDRKDIPRITYFVCDKKHYYFPDIYIPTENKIIEVKSTWTYNSNTDNIQHKEKATKEAGYNYEIWVYNSKGEKIDRSELDGQKKN